jgi:[ribosomal protein S5]-alanine N-acetyltransferase
LTTLVQSERLLLRLPEDGDVPRVVRYYRDNREHLQPWSPRFSAEIFEPNYWLDQVAERQAELEAGLGARAFIFRKDDPATVIGNLSLNQVQRGPAQYCLMGYSLAAAAQGQGYMVEAVCAAVGYAFRVLSLHRVMANYMPHNVRSAAVLRRAGFTVEGYARDYILINGRWEDHVLTAMVNADWKA